MKLSNLLTTIQTYVSSIIRAAWIDINEIDLVYIIRKFTHIGTLYP